MGVHRRRLRKIAMIRRSRELLWSGSGLLLRSTSVTNCWATSGVDLHLELTGHRRRQALEQALRDAVADGRLPSGSRLPSSRSLAEDLGLARNTVVEAYSQLVAEGWLSARRGSATRVCAHVPTTHPGQVEGPEVTRGLPYDLRPGGPDLSSFPRSAWITASRRAWYAASFADLGYGDPMGTGQLRHALAGYLGRARGVRTDASRIMICSGFTQAWALLCRTLLERGADSVALEAYGLQHLGQIAAQSKFSVVSVPVDEEGADFALVPAASAAVVTPAHQFPLGWVLSPQRRRAAVGWARATRALIVEDDYDGEFRYDRDPLGALQGLDPEHIIYVGTASKTLAPGLRLAWLALPPDLVRPLESIKLLTDRHAPVLEQLTLAQFISSGAYDRHIRRRRLVYRHRRDLLVAALGAGRVEGASAGLHVIIRLPEGMAEATAIARAAERGLAVEGLQAYRLGAQDHAPSLVVGYASPPDHLYPKALSALLAALD